jgi:molybdopterin converting factor subunit 1
MRNSWHLPNQRNPVRRDKLTSAILIWPLFMQVRILFFGILKELAGKSKDRLELPEGASVRDVLEQYASRMPKIRESLSSLAVAVNKEYAGAETVLKENDEVALLPPVSGGSTSGGLTGEGSARSEASKTPAELAANHPPDETTVSIIREPIDTLAALDRMKRGEDGAAVVFEGVVRNQTRGRKTLYLDYEAYADMALRQMEGLREQALKQFQVRDVVLIHRLGRLTIGETSVLIVVASAHRAAAFDACRWLIDTLKRTVPIWKKEYFEDGAVWADGEPFPAEIPRALGSPPEADASK